MTETARLVIAVDSTGAKTATDDLRKLSVQSKSTDSQARALGATFGRLAAAFAGGVFFKSVIANTIESENALAQLNATIKSTGGAAGLTSEELVEMAQGLQAVTTFGDDAIISMQAQLLTFTKIGKDVVPKATEAILDLATKMGGDLKGAAVQVGKALNDPVKGITALSRVGVTFTEDQKAVIESLVRTGDVAGAQKIILAELAVEFGGSARAARDTFGGALTSLQNSLGDLLEGSGGNLTDAKTAVEDLNKAISDPAVKEAFATITAGILSVATAAANALPAITGFTQWAAEELAATINGAAIGDVVRLGDELESLQKKLSLTNPQDAVGLERINAQIAATQAKIKATEDSSRADFNAKLASDQLAESQKKQAPATATASEELSKKTEVDRESARAAKLAADAAAAQTAAIQSQISALEFQAATVGKDKDEVTLLKLALDGATDSQIAAAQAALGTVSAYEDQAAAAEVVARAEEERAAKGRAITLEARSDLEVLADKQQEYFDALQNGSITQETYGKISEKNSQAMRDVAGGASEASTALDDFTKTAQENIQSQLADTLVDGFNGSFSDILSSWGNLIQRMIAEAAAAQLTKSLFDSLDIGGGAGGGGGFDLSGIFSSFDGFFDSGGRIGAGKFGVVGERGPEIVRGPANVTSRADTAKMTSGNTIIINQPGVSNTREAERSAGATRRAVMGAVNSGARYA
jgi:hypothetical protein